jgi:hypothetical protein
MLRNLSHLKRATIPDRMSAHIDALRKLAENGSDDSMVRGAESDIDSQVILVGTVTRESSLICWGWGLILYMKVEAVVNPYDSFPLFMLIHDYDVLMS